MFSGHSLNLCSSEFSPANGNASVEKILTAGVLEYYNYDVTQAFNSSSYPVGRFASEYGFHSHPSYDTYANYMPSQELYFNSSLIVHRNRHYPATNEELVVPNDPATRNLTALSLGGMGQMSQGAELYYPKPKKSSEKAQFRSQIYVTQLFQAEFVRSQIEFYRWGSGQPQRTMGSLYWMLNDVWAAPTWSSIDTDGRWKMLHYLSGRSYEPVIIAPYVSISHGSQSPKDLTVSATSDLWDTVKGNATIDWYDWAGNLIHSGKPESIQIEPNNSTFVMSIDDMQDLPFNTTTAVAFLSVSVSTTGGKHYTNERVHHIQPLSSTEVMQSMVDPKLTVTYDEASQLFTIQSHALAAWVWLEQPSHIQGHWKDNAFWMLPGTRQVRFVPQNSLTPDASLWGKNVTIQSIWDLTAA